MGRMSKEEFRRFLDALLSEDKVAEVQISFRYDNSLKFTWKPVARKRTRELPQTGNH